MKTIQIQKVENGYILSVPADYINDPFGSEKIFICTSLWDTYSRMEDHFEPKPPKPHVPAVPV